MIVSDATNKTVIAIVLAAGQSSRFGATKQLAEVDGMSLVNRSVQAAGDSRVQSTAVVVGHDWQAVCRSIAPARAFLVRNEDHANGIGSSLALAARATRHAADAIIVMLADQPLVTSAHLDNLIDAWTGAANEIIATSYTGVSGPPVLFGSACFGELATLEGDSGARALLKNPRYMTREVEFADAAIDIDCQDDLNLLPHSARS